MVENKGSNKLPMTSDKSRPTHHYNPSERDAEVSSITCRDSDSARIIIIEDDKDEEDDDSGCNEN